MGETSQEDAEAIGNEAARSFQSTMMEHYRKTDPTLAPDAGLWDVPRLKELAALLEWDNPPPVEKIGELRLNEFRQRRVLPTPLGVLNQRPTSRREMPAGENRSNRPNARPQPSSSTQAQTGKRMLFPDDLVELQVKYVQPRGVWVAIFLGREVAISGIPPTGVQSGESASLEVARGGTSPTFRWPAQ